MNALLKQCKNAAVRLAQDRSLSILVVLNLTIGIGATTTVFSLVNTFFLRPPSGVGEAHELVSASPRPIQIPGLLSGAFQVPLSYPSYRAYAEGEQDLVELASHQPIEVHAVIGERVERLDAEVVSPNYFSVLRSSAHLGRLFSPEREHPEGRGDVAVLSYDLWKTSGGDPDLVGERILLNGAPFTVVGVAAPGFHGTRVAARPEIWVPITAALHVVPGMDADTLHDPEHGWLFWFVGRLRPGVDLAAAQDRMDATSAGLEERGASDEQSAGLVLHSGIGLRPHEERSALEVLAVLMTVVGSLLLIACLNTAVLLLSRVPQRRKGIGVRFALGASRASVVRDLLVESALLGLGGAAGGVLLCQLATRLLSRLDFASFLPEVEEIVIDGRVLAFAFALGLLSALLFGLVPALRSSRVDLVSTLKGLAPRAAHGEGLQHLLVVGQVGASVVLLLGGGLLARSLLNYREVDLGFDPQNVLDVRFDLERQGYDEASGRAFLERVLDQVSGLPGVEIASFGASVPLARDADRAVAQVAPASGSLTGETEAWVTYNAVGPDYFATLRIPLTRGRELTRQDRQGGVPVAVVNEALARKLWPEENPIGQWMSAGERELRVVGVVGDSKTESLTGPPQPYFYIPLGQSYRPVVTLHVRSRLDTPTLLGRVEATIHELDPHLPLFARGLLGEQVAAAMSRPRLAVLFVGQAALLGLLLSVVGIGGVVYRSTVARLKETGIRLSMGAQRADLLRLYLRRGLATTGLGLALGLFAGLALSKALASLLYGVSPYDPTIAVLVLGLTGGLSLLANAVPAYLGARVDPAEILRQE